MSRDLEIASFGKTRIEALTDGIFSIAMTVLVLTLEAPKLSADATDEQVLDAVGKLMPSGLAFVASFVTLGMFWIGHHSIFRFIQKPDRVLLWMNIYFLMFVSLVPFTSSFYSDDANSRLANAMFGGNLVILGLISFSMWAYASRHKGYVSDDIPEDVRRFIVRRTLTVPLVASIALAASLIQPLWAEAIYFAMVPVFMFSVKRLDIALPGRKTGE